MHIARIELEDIKAYKQASFDFLPGTTAITGENGAGKTTLIEAVAWTLFDVLDYKKDDFVRRGAKKGTAKVTFVSGLDEREYTIVRDTGTGYYVHDPRLDIRVADKKEDVTRFLWQHLGVDAGTDLSSLFRHAIGVPQGTLTAIFLATPAERKRTFDRLLKVEEYRRGAEELLQTQRFVESRVTDTRERIARSEGEISRIPVLIEELDVVRNELKTQRSESAELAKSVEQIKMAVAAMDDQRAKLDAANAALQKASAAAERAKLVAEQRSKELEASESAAANARQLAPDVERYEASIATLKSLEKERAERDGRRSKIAAVENALSAINATQKQTAEALAEIESSRVDIERLRPLANEQETAEKRLNELRERLAEIRSYASHADKLGLRVLSLRNSFSALKKEVDEAERLSQEATRRAELERREGEIVAETARIAARIERDESFQREIKNGLCPILSEKCLNLAEGQTLESFVTNQFGELRSQLATLETEKTSVAKDLQAARDAEGHAVRAASLKERLAEVSEEGVRLRAEKDEADKKAAEREPLEKEVEALQMRLTELGDPKRQIGVIEAAAAREAALKQKASESESERKKLDDERFELAGQIEKFAETDARIAEAARLRDESEGSYKRLLSLKGDIDKLDARRETFKIAQAELEKANAELAVAEKEAKSAGSGYDRDEHQKRRGELSVAESKLSAVNVRLENAEKRSGQLDADLNKLLEVKDSLKAEIAERERLEKVAAITVFIRDTLKEAAPLVAGNYVRHVSIEANQLFREIFGSAETSLHWRDDYGIVLEEDGHERPFQSLSGGEQTAAAISVRLALLKQLSDIRIAFFDEPTTNMDADRRESLAMQIGQISHFDQLFVISHDDTFEGYLDHEIRVDKI